ncbi:hypothetical protein COCSUDRAFT_83561 [Coccomyxa subellipsoidea C-169]|uniref:WDR19 WD40 repeat domain-containing protein n=1 Tax=Coccomyxa subellipsoidea (strain C-169) TaxID=574566 RepID=I0YM91_COCSC|nr:hypothetical protein COCSUDRAFT_83561 [Coccomyxa subellipsoidea C-169]EIE19510.1 hypothetical protein COCSUDRAFT_83561 [Coccomyxa subellipsoidea C-169]|eukprot:XP_005644054.1 hypothetical protein COCSUDRAFT_83561 [Coccomyxa subellipsoidea C-169]
MEGIIVVVSAPSKGPASQMQVYNCFANALTASAFCAAAGRAAVASGGRVAVLAVAETVQECREDAVSIPGDVSSLSWSPDGLLLAVSSMDGPVHVFLAALPAVCAVRDCSIACLTNLREVTITDFSTGAGSKLRCPVVVEPAFLALGTHHLAVGLDCKIACTRQGDLWYYSCEDRACVAEHRLHNGPAAFISPERSGVRTLCSTNDGHMIVHSALDNSCVAVPAFQGPLVAALWDALDRNVFLLSSGKMLHVFVLELTAINGPGIKHLGSQPASAELSPVLLVGGRLISQHTNGSLDSTILDTHKPLEAVDVGVRGDERLLMRVRAAIAIGRMQQARDTAAMLNKTAGWQALAAAAVHSMDIQLAIE